MAAAVFPRDASAGGGKSQHQPAIGPGYSRAAVARAAAGEQLNMDPTAFESQVGSEPSHRPPGCPAAAVRTS